MPGIGRACDPLSCLCISFPCTKASRYFPKTEPSSTSSPSPQQLPCSPKTQNPHLPSQPPHCTGWPQLPVRVRVAFGRGASPLSSASMHRIPSVWHTLHPCLDPEPYPFLLSRSCVCAWRQRLVPSAVLLSPCVPAGPATPSWAHCAEDGTQDQCPMRACTQRTCSPQAGPAWEVGVASPRQGSSSLICSSWQLRLLGFRTQSCLPLSRAACDHTSSRRTRHGVLVFTLAASSHLSLLLILNPGYASIDF